ncbi:hypothetical protein L6164_037725 [Bauhinia variegata]|uniref:Uncharacterized protein n=1 Tax=Bauhinia variegata TaxID=167791 RepID=A0ACB9KKX6_BAUVA|nr:hypothetical protein L6164_037725 [Bauhinia variegata]
MSLHPFASDSPTRTSGSDPQMAFASMLGSSSSSPTAEQNGGTVDETSYHDSFDLFSFFWDQPFCFFKKMLEVSLGSLIGHPVENLRVVLTDGASHAVDSSELAFKLASIYAFRQVLLTNHGCN